MSTTRLLVLGCVRIFQPVHGYDVRRELMSWHANEWASVAPGSIYSALKTLVKDGMLEVVGTGHVGGRPERTSYKLTARGEEEHRSLLRDTWWNVHQLADPLMAAVSMLGFVPRADAIAALEHRVSVIRLMVAHGEFLDRELDDRDQPAHIHEMFRLSNARLASEIAWAEALLARLRAGEYLLLGDELPASPVKSTGKRVKAIAKPEAKPVARRRRS